jgi:hypothetical protein
MHDFLTFINLVLGGNMHQDMVFFVEKISESLPPIFTRSVAVSNLGGLLGAKTLANIDNKGKGPTSKIRMGKKVLYERDSFIEWLKQYYKLS